MECTLENIKGLYVGDVWYALEDKIYRSDWNKNEENEAEDGLQFAVAGTPFGNGGYLGSDGREYSVDTSAIGVVDLRLATKNSLEELDRLGRVFPNADKVEFKANNGCFWISVFEDGKRTEEYEIDTLHEYIYWMSEVF